MIRCLAGMRYRGPNVWYISRMLLMADLAVWVIHSWLPSVWRGTGACIRADKRCDQTEPAATPCLCATSGDLCHQLSKDYLGNCSSGLHPGDERGSRPQSSGETNPQTYSDETRATLGDVPAGAV